MANPVLPPDNCYYTIYPESSDDTFDPSHDWRESLETTSPGDVHLSMDGGSTATMHGWVPYNKLRSFCLYALGYAAAQKVSPWRMLRINPRTHPIFPFLRVKSISLRGLEPRAAKGVTPLVPPPDLDGPPVVNPPPADLYPYPTGLNLPGSQVRDPVEFVDVWGEQEPQPANTIGARMYSMRPRRAGENFGGGSSVTPDRFYYPFAKTTSRYEKARVVVDFWQPNYPIKEDSDPDFNPDDESDRNVFWTTEPTLDVLTLEGGAGNFLFWREGRTVAGGGTVPVIANNIPGANSATSVQPPNSGFRSPLGILDPKTMDVANWLQVPTRFIFDGNLIPTKILECLGKVNASEWYGYAPGTALFIGVSFKPVAWPIHSTDHHVVQLWDVRYMFKYYNPKRRPDADLTPNPAGEGKLGWRTFYAPDGFAYFATRFNGDDLYEGVEFSKLFEHREKP